MTEYWKSKLNNKLQSVYENCLASFKREERIIDCGNVDPDDIVEIYSAVLKDHPEIFYPSPKVEMQQKRMLYSINNCVVADYLFSIRESKEIEKEMEEVSSKLIAKCAGLGEREKEVIICDYFIENVRYEIDVINNQNAASVLKYGKGQCSGIAKAVKYLFDKLNVECIVVDGNARGQNGIEGAHSWNIVRIDGNYYHLDVTFIAGANGRRVKPYKYVYLNYSDGQISKDHFWDANLTPKCTSVENLPSGSRANSGDNAPQKNIPQQTFGNESFEDDEQYDKIYSLSEFREKIGIALSSGKKVFVFKSLIKCGSDNELFRYLRQYCVKAMEETRKATSADISLKNRIVTITFG